MHALDVNTHVILHNLVRPGSRDLVDLFLRQQQSGIALANDTSCGVGYAPLDKLERMALDIEQKLNNKSTKAQYPHIGEDIKVMAIRHQDTINITLGCAFIDQYIANFDDYMQKKSALISMVDIIATEHVKSKINISVNAVDGTDLKSIYLAASGTSAAADKNPVTDVGKLYNIAAQLMALRLVDEFDEVTTRSMLPVECKPITEPQIADGKVKLQDNQRITTIEKKIHEIVGGQLLQIPSLLEKVITQGIRIF